MVIVQGPIPLLFGRGLPLIFSPPSTHTWVRTLSRKRVLVEWNGSGMLLDLIGDRCAYISLSGRQRPEERQIIPGVQRRLFTPAREERKRSEELKELKAIMSRQHSSILPGEEAFADFKKQCLSTENWINKYDSDGMQVWIEVQKNSVPKVHKIKCKMAIKDVSAATMYDVIHDGEYRKRWDPNVLESFDIARLSDNADVGYYSWICPKPIKNRDVVTLRSWQVTDDEYTIINFSVKHPKHPPHSHLVRAVSILTGYLIKPTGPNSCTFIYLSQADPKGSLPKWVVNKASQVLAPRVMMSVHKAGQNYPAWKQQNSPNLKPWLHPEQSTLATMDPAELSIQRADSLENVDELTKLDVMDSENSS
ncbi:START domain containing 14 [Nothobranchius furzeri]|uniref:START domain-containing protein 10 n=3 Tax=Nothobranchius TaxID=28779 RepID=A0A1A8B4B4_NOTFU|nr:PCTP-like protein [Nothobranchius furzeri]